VQRPRSDLPSPAIHEQFNTCDETGVLGCQKKHGFSNFIGFSHPSHRDGGHNPCNGVFRLSIDNRRISRPWANHVGTNMTVFEIRGPGSDEGTEGCLRCAVDAEGGRTFQDRYRAVDNN
jgi:hypothetical protein